MLQKVLLLQLAANSTQLLNKDFYHTQAANLEIKSKTPNGVV